MAIPYKNIVDRWTTLETARLSPTVFQPHGEPGFHQWNSEHERLTYTSTGNFYSPDHFGYVINSEGLRCEELVPSDDFDLRIVFIGCSFTFGFGVPVEHTFGHRLVSKLRRRGLKVPYWNLGFSGTSIDYAVRTLYQFMPRLKPDLVVALFPHETRREVFSYCHSTHKPKFFNYLSDMPNHPFDVDLVEDFYSEANQNYHVARLYGFFDTLMAAHECEYLWDNWSHTSELTANQKALMPPGMLDRRINYDRMAAEALPKGRDLLHWGPNGHLSISKSIYDKIGPLIDKAKARRQMRGD